MTEPPISLPRALPLEAISPVTLPPVTLVAWDGVELLDLAGPGEVFAVAGLPVRVATVRPGQILSQGFLKIEPSGLVQETPAGGILVVPGGNSEGARADAPLIEAIAHAAAHAELVLSVCTGALVLAEARLLDGLRATTWHGALDTLRTLAPQTEVVEGVRWVDNGRIVTAAGVSAGIDAALHVVARFLGPEARDRVARHMEYPVQPSDAANPLHARAQV